MRGMLRTRITSAAGAVTLLTAGLICLSAGQADAMSRVNYCGSSYGFLKSWAIKDGWYPNPTVGYIDVYYNSSNGNNCVITRANDSEVGGANHIIAGIRKSGSSTWKLDGNNSNYTSYAGPLYVYAAGSCIDIYGELNYTSGGTGAGGGRTVYEDVHCG
ncbi:hypothetical protein ABZT06_29310 [Streptomyces sp. NPDC005483]|uniref:hypothetical protein n=1 Tax=Streptomyces sp. NPDC005483 TaxID=3154882 RepID=UPI00339E7550